MNKLYKSTDLFPLKDAHGRVNTLRLVPVPGIRPDAQPPDRAHDGLLCQNLAAGTPQVPGNLPLYLFLLI